MRAQNTSGASRIELLAESKFNQLQYTINADIKTGAFAKPAGRS